MDWEKVFSWLEQKTGVSYDLNEDISSIAGDIAFSQPFLWQMKISFILEDMETAIDAVEDFQDELTEDLPSRSKLQKGIENEYIRKLAENVNNVKRQLGMSITQLNDGEDILMNVGGLFELISTMKAFPIDSLQTREWFDKYDEASENVLTDTLGLHKNDLVDIHQTIETIIESLTDDDDDLDDDDIDDVDDE